ncbi:unannotated protein [freshwater metagenome]|uniref:DNA 3'-5' helicase n=1 Tax=freshwater metagenome TaxID=449393 RepID=A0A6J5ZVE5_9ZZZZ|nr:AAA family ATPase [Actinomycetota bacterium]
MSKLELTAEQQLAVERREGALLLAAGAGSGKTGVLVERFVRDVTGRDSQPIAVDEILAITFTRAAAAEMRGRIRERLTDRGHPELAAQVESAWLLTIDAFCARILRNDAVLAGVDPSFEVLEDEVAGLALRHQAWDLTVAELFADPERRDRLIGLLAATDEDGLRESVLSIYSRLRSAGHSEPRMPQPRETDVAGVRERVLELAALTLVALEGEGEGKSVAAARAKAADCIERLGDGSALPVASLIRDWLFDRRVEALKQPPASDFHDSINKLLAEVANQAMRDRVMLLDDLLASFGESYRAAKKRRGVLDYSDLELGARDLLRDHEPVAAFYREKFRRVMIDEFQDTNALQLQIFEALGVENLFMVGDELQSIYGFRDADIELFRARSEAHGRAGEREILSINFRSDREVVAFINAGFGPMHGDSYQPLMPATGEGIVEIDQPAAASEAATELLLCDAAWGQSDAIPAGFKDRLPAGIDDDDAAEALMIAQRIRELCDAGECEPGDVAILVRQGASIAGLVAALQRAGLPAVANSARGWWERPEVADLIAYLRLLANREDEDALFAVLASPLIGVSPDTLALLGYEARGGEGGLDAAVARAVSSEGEGPAAEITDEQRQRLRRGIGIVAAERNVVGWEGPGRLLERVIAETGFDALVARGADGSSALLRVRRLIRIAHQFEARESSGLRTFVDELARRAEIDDRVSDAPPGSASGAVQVMTMHGSKGLQFPVVVLAALGRKGMSAGPSVLVDGDRIGVRLRDDSALSNRLFDFGELDDERKERELAEVKRLLHVAMTRAERRLILSGTVDLKRDWFKDQSVGRPPLVWIAGLLLDPELYSGADGCAEELADRLVEVSSGGWRAPLRVRLNRPGPGSQLSLALIDSAPKLAYSADSDGTPEIVLPAESDQPVRAPTLSYSSLATYKSCGYRWYLKHVLRLPDRDRPSGAGGGDARARGQVAHALLERADLSAAASAPSDDQIRASAAAHDLEPDTAMIVRLRGYIESILANPLRERLERAQREISFSLPLSVDTPSAPMLTGIIDALDISPGLPALLVDYKTDAVRPSDDLERKVADNYAVQRALYALAVLRGSDAEQVDVVHLFLERPDQPVTASFSRADVPALEQQLSEAAAGLIAAEYPVATEPWKGLCGDCPGRGGLCPVPPELADRDSPSAQ